MKRTQEQRICKWRDPGRKREENVRGPHTTACCVCTTTFVQIGHSKPSELHADGVFQCAQVSVLHNPSGHDSREFTRS